MCEHCGGPIDYEITPRARFCSRRCQNRDKRPPQDPSGFHSPIALPSLRPDGPTDKAWKSQAACRGMPASVFFPNYKGEDKTALALCATCPVQDQCKAYGMRLGNELEWQDGVWGGTTRAQRKREIKNRSRK